MRVRLRYELVIFVLVFGLVVFVLEIKINISHIPLIIKIWDTFLFSLMDSHCSTKSVLPMP